MIRVERSRFFFVTCNAVPQLYCHGIFLNAEVTQTSKLCLYNRHFISLFLFLVVLIVFLHCVILMLSMMHELYLLACRSRRALPALLPIIASFMTMRKKLRTLVLRLRLRKNIRMRYDSLMSVVPEFCWNSCFFVFFFCLVCSVLHSLILSPKNKRV